MQLPAPFINRNNLRQGRDLQLAKTKVLNEILESVGEGPIRQKSVRDFFLNWLSGKQQAKKETTGRRYKKAIQEFLDSLGTRADKSLGALTPADIEHCDEAHASRTRKGKASEARLEPQAGHAACREKRRRRSIGYWFLSPTLDTRIVAYLDALPPGIAGQHGHNATYYVACRLVWGFALSPEDAWEFMLAFNVRCEPPWSESELRHKLNNALIDSGHQYPRGHLLHEEISGIGHAPLPPVPPKPKPQYDPEALASVAARIDLEVTPEWLEARSKLTCWNRSPAGVLHKLYRLGEKVLVFNVFESQGCEVWEHKGNGQDLSTLNYLVRGQSKGVWFMAQPVDGGYHWNPRQEKDSRRSEESVCAWRYLVIESDKAPKDLWLKALVQMPLPIAAVYDSGGDSIHVLVRIDAESKAQWDEGRDAIKPSLVKLGADPGALTAVRLTRLPNCRRENKKQLQRLLYLNDQPDCVPLCQKPYPLADNSRPRKLKCLYQQASEPL